jgi:hypothetical protein
MEHGQVVLDLLLSADEQLPKAVQPRVRMLDYPTSGMVAGNLPLLLGFFDSSLLDSPILPPLLIIPSG